MQNSMANSVLRSPTVTNSNWLSDVDVYVNSVSTPQAQEEAKERLTSLLFDGHVSILSLVKGLGDYLTTGDSGIRAKGTLLLGELVKELSDHPLPKETLTALASFFGGRLLDFPAIGGAATGALALLQRPPSVGELPPEVVLQLATEVLTQLHVQSLTQPNRMLALQLLEALLLAPAVSTLGPQLIEGAIAAVDGEKDPRCLLVAFRIVALMGQRLAGLERQLEAEYAEELFDVISCYFPLSFTPAANDRWGISRDDLATALMGAFSATTAFAPFAIPLLLEKLSSDLPAAKMDALKYLAACATSYGPASMKLHVSAIWAAMKTLLLPSNLPGAVSLTPGYDVQDQKIREAAEMCLEKVLFALDEGQASSGSCTTVDAAQKSERQVLAGHVALQATARAYTKNVMLDLLLGDESVEDLLRALGRLSAPPTRPGWEGPGSTSTLAAGPGMSRELGLGFEAAGRVLVVAAKASPGCAARVIRRVLPQTLLTISKTFKAAREGPTTLSTVCQVAASELPMAIDNLDSSAIVLAPRNGEIPLTARSPAPSPDLPGGSLEALRLARDLFQAAAQAGDEATRRERAGTGGGRVPVGGGREWADIAEASLTPLLAVMGNGMRGQEDEAAICAAVALRALASLPPAISPLAAEHQCHLITAFLDLLLQQDSPTWCLASAVDALVHISNAEECHGASQPDMSRQVSSEDMSYAPHKMLPAGSGVEEKEALVLSSAECGRERSQAELPILSLALPRLLTAVASNNSLPANAEVALRALAAMSASRPALLSRVLQRMVELISLELAAVQNDGPSQGNSWRLAMLLRWTGQKLLPLLGTSEIQQLAPQFILTLWGGRGAFDALQDEQLLPAAARIARVGSQQCSLEQQKAFLNIMAVNFPNFAVKAENRLPAMVLLGSVLIGLRPQVFIPERSFLVDVLLATACLHDRPNMSGSSLETFLLAAETSSQALASLINKWPKENVTAGRAKEGERTSGGAEEDEGLDGALVRVLDHCIFKVLFNTTGQLSEAAGGVLQYSREVAARERACSMLGWVGKALAMRGHRRVAAVAEALVSVLQGGAPAHLGAPAVQSAPSATRLSTDQSETSIMLGSDGTGRADGMAPLHEQESAQSAGQNGISPSGSGNVLEEKPVQSDRVERAAASALHRIVVDHEDCLSKASHAIQRPLYKQRFFVAMLAPLAAAISQAKGDRARLPFYWGFASMLAGTPQMALLSEPQKVFPLLLQTVPAMSIDRRDAKLLQSALLALSSFLTDSGQARGVCGEHLTAVVGTLLPLTAYQFSAEVRETALQCLTAVVGFPHSLVYPLKSQVAKPVAAALDDPKRSVRRQAIRCKLTWT